jgi:hypothetical protein
MSAMRSVMTVRAVVVAAFAVRVVGMWGPWAVPSISVVASSSTAIACAPQRNDPQNTESNRECNHLKRPFTNPG